MSVLGMRLWLLCIFVMRLVSAVYSAFNGPSDVTVVESDTAVLTCSAGAGVTIAYSTWSDEDGNFATVEGLLKTTDKYSNFELVNADTANGQMDLRITNTQLDDQGTYTCQFNADPSISAMLTVEAQVTSVTLTVNGASGSSVDVVAGNEQTLVCTAYGARPRVGIDWTNNGVIVSGDTETESINGDTTDTTSTLLYNPSRNDNGHEFKCVTTGQQAATPQSQSVTLNMQFAPVDVVVEYSQGTITCSSVANPTVADNQYAIFLNDTQTIPRKTYSYDPECHGCTAVKCTATNAIGTGTDSLAEHLCPDAVPIIAASTVVVIIGAFGGGFVTRAVTVILVVVFLMRRNRHKSSQRKDKDIVAELQLLQAILQSDLGPNSSPGLKIIE